LCARGESPDVDADEAVGRVGRPIRGGQPESSRNAGANPEVRYAVDAVAVRQIGGIEEAGLTEGQQICPQLRIRQANRRPDIDVSKTAVSGGHWFAFERSKADVERQRDVVCERRIEDVDGDLLILEEAVDFLLCERPRTVAEVVVDRDLHGVFFPPSQA